MFCTALNRLIEHGQVLDQRSEIDQQLLETLKNITDGLKQLKNREILDCPHIDVFVKILGQELEAVVKEASSVAMKLPNHDVCVECLRCLRNSCVDCSRNQNLLCNTEAISFIKKLVDVLTRHPEGSKQATTLCCAIQVLSNIGSGNKQAQQMIWMNIFPDTLWQLLKYADNKVQTYTCMLICHSLTSDLQQLLIMQPQGLAIIDTILELSTKETEQDWCLQILQELLKSSGFFLEVYDSFSHNSRVTFLDVTAALLSNDTDNSLVHETVTVSSASNACSQPHVPVLSIAYLAEKFEECTKYLTGFIEDSDTHSRNEIELLVPLRLLKVLCFATSNLQIYRPLQDRTSLLVCALGLLQSAHLLKPKIESTSSTLYSGQQDIHPSHGFKRDLIRLVGNMCFRHTYNQNKVRELEGIPLLLDNCTIDSNNPFISQWATLAIRNVCENNRENQEIIKGMNTKGIASSDMIQSMGIQTEIRDGQVYIKTKPK
ncbi:ataxin-10-like isoform X2 [Anneissia japonica]|uniref:ataxin-10-like isoform X2 n=1 Tax=Anneissia japonica TaxID=1529436 RepID=UPI001425B909|nr:ataxin-10-like isoform X2 [Anneissia japonica]